MMTAAHPAILPAPLHFRSLERVKIRAARRDPTCRSTVHVSPTMEVDLRWWIKHSHAHNGRPLQIQQWDLTIETDASLTGLGASCQRASTGGPWIMEERAHHINFLELLAPFLALKAFLSGQGPISVLLCMDNITAIAFLNRVGGTHSLPLSKLAVEIWEWCIERKFIIHAEHLPGVENIRADWLSRHLRDSSDWRMSSWSWRTGSARSLSTCSHPGRMPSSRCTAVGGQTLQQWRWTLCPFHGDTITPICFPHSLSYTAASPNSGRRRHQRHS